MNSRDGAFTLNIIENGKQNASTRLILAHGAGVGMASPFLESMADLISHADIAVVRFEFEYMAARSRGGPKRPPPRAEALMSGYIDAVRTVVKQGRPGQRLLVGGKSLGGRVASLVADELYESNTIVGLACLGYPFHPPGEPDKLRTRHLEHLRCPALIVQGERDPFGNRAEIEKLAFPKTIGINWISDGDHDLRPRARSGLTQQTNLAAAADAVAAFATRLQSPR